MVYTTGRAAADSRRRVVRCALVGIGFTNPNKCTPSWFKMHGHMKLKTSEKYIEIKYLKRRTETHFKSVRVLTWFVEKLVKYV
jgi:hypothetical protein